MPQRLGIYPFGRECEPLVRHFWLLQNYTLSVLVSPKSWGYSGHTYSLKNGGKVIVESSLECVRDKYDVLLIPELHTTESVERKLISKVCAEVPYLREIVCDAWLHSSAINALKTACQQYGCKLLTRDIFYNPESFGLIREPDRQLKSIPVPVVLVAGTWEDTDKTEASLAIRTRFLKDGYRVSQIGSRFGCELFGYHSFPAFMFRPDIDESDKVCYFNAYVQSVIHNEQPDVFIITVPGAIHSYNLKFTNHFGLLAFEVCQAVNVDYLLLCSFYDPSPEECLEQLRLSCQYRFGHPVNGFHLTNAFIDPIASSERNAIVIRRVQRENITRDAHDRFAILPTPVFDVLDETSADSMYEHILGTLTSETPTIQQ